MMQCVFPMRIIYRNAGMAPYIFRTCYDAAGDRPMAISTTERDERIDLRVSAELKALLARAASYSGMSLSGFLVSSAAERAKEVVAKRETLTLTARDWRVFLSGLEKPERRRPRLEAAAKRYLGRRTRGER